MVGHHQIIFTFANVAFKSSMYSQQFDDWQFSISLGKSYEKISIPL